jgi:hypothetical protein
LRKSAFLAAAICGFLLFASFASAQQADFSFGVGTLTSPGNFTSTNTTFTVPEKGGAYPAVGFDVIFHKRIGLGFEAAWKASQGAYGGCDGCQPFRPILYDVNGVFQPRFGKKVGADLMAGIGAQSTRFYLPYCTNGFTCSNYTSSNHFDIHLGGGIRYYFWHHLFVRPELHYYRVFNNTDEWSSDNLIRVGASIGYTLGPE